jgi:serine/threonine-protein kinase
MLTGERLFQGDSDLVVLELVRKAEVEPPSRVNPDVSPALDAVVLKALAREPDNRYTTGSEMLRDLESVLYSYSPAPGAADLAIYLDRLREARASAAEVRPEAAGRAAAAAPVPAGSEAVPVAELSAAPAPEFLSEVTAEPVAGQAAEAGVFGSFSAARIESEKKGRTPLYIGMAAVVAIGVLLAVLLTRKGPVPAPANAVTPGPAPTAAPVAVDLTPAALVPTPAARDQRTVEQEVQRQLAAKRLEAKNQKALEMSARLTALPKPAAVPAAVAARPTQVVVARGEPTAVPLAPTSPPPEPTQVVLAPPPAPREPAETIASREKAAASPREPAPQAAAPPAAAPPEAEVSRGDLVGPGPGVVEPALLTPPRINYPPMARQQKISGRVVILVLVNEQGSVSDARVQKGIGGRNGIDTVVLNAVRSAHFRAATKNGIPVKMWRTVVVDVKP